MSGCWIIAAGYERWEFVFPLLVLEFAKGEGRHTETRICVVVYERIGGRCVSYMLEFFDTALHAPPFAHPAYLTIVPIKLRFRICALDRYRCWQESRSLEAIRQSVFLMLFGMIRIRAVYPVIVQTNPAAMHLGSMQHRKDMRSGRMCEDYGT